MTLPPVLVRNRGLTILLGGTVVAVADMAVAMGYWATKGVVPTRILHSVAAGWLGRDAAIAGGLATAMLGAVSHLAIALAMVWCYWAISRRLPLLVERPLACGLAYGVATWAAMRFVVLPLSAAGGGGGQDLLWQALHFASHLLVIGLPSAWLARSMRA
jgi:hypothetical protein